MFRRGTVAAKDILRCLKIPKDASQDAPWAPLGVPMGSTCGFFGAYFGPWGLPVSPLWPFWGAFGVRLVSFGALGELLEPLSIIFMFFFVFLGSPDQFSLYF